MAQNSLSIPILSLPAFSGCRILTTPIRLRRHPHCPRHQEMTFLLPKEKPHTSRHFHGKKTASGEFFNLNHFTAAHRSLAFGTSVRVINLANGKDVVVRINDRGPFRKGRIIDVSPAAAKKIGLLSTGTANVRIEAYN